MTCEHAALRAMHPQGSCILCDVTSNVSGEHTSNAPDKTKPDARQADRAVVGQVLQSASLADLRYEKGNRTRKSLAKFFRDGWSVLEPATPLDWNWHLDEVCNHIQAVIEDWVKRKQDPTHEQRVRDLLASLGPGTGKSRIGVYIVPWAWLEWPEMTVRALSCNPRVALRDSMLSRDVIASEWYQQSFRPEWKIREDADSKSSYINTKGGFRAAMGIEAKIVGERSDLIWIDDPHDPDEVHSAAQRNAVHDRWMSIANRLNDMSVSIRMAIAHRTHIDDWSSRRIEEGWCELRLPTEFDSERPCRTIFGGDQRKEQGESLHPKRLTPAVISVEKKRLGMMYPALHQQDPANAAGAVIKTANLRFHRAPGMPDASLLRPHGLEITGPAVETPATFDAICIGADLAGGKETKAGDFNAIVSVGKRAARFYVLRAWRKRADFPVVQDEFRSFARQFPMARKIVEAAASGAALVTSLENEFPGLVGRPPKGDKIMNMQGVLAYFQAANVFLDENHPEIKHGPDGEPGLVDELITFGAGAKHDDFADALRIALAELGQIDEEAAERRRRLVLMALSAFDGKPGQPAIDFVNGALTRAGQSTLSDGEIALSPRLSGAASKRGGFGFSGFTVGGGFGRRGY